MARYIAHWELDSSRIPVNPKEKKSQHLGFQDLVQKQLKEGIIKEWGVFLGETSGYVIFEGNSADLHTLTSSWVPFVHFKINEFLTIEEAKKATRALPE